MATLKEHQAAMVDLLANGSGIPASASRLAHAMHDLIAAHLAVGDITFEFVTNPLTGQITKREVATTPGLNDKALSKPQKALKTDSPAKWPTPAEQRVKELENTIRQLKANNAKLRADKCELEDQVEAYRRMAIPEQAGCRKDDTQVCNHSGSATYYGKVLSCDKCGEDISGPTEVCKHDWYMDFIGPDKCRKCGESRK